MSNPISDDELLARMHRANPVTSDLVRGSFDSVAVRATLEEIVRSPTGRIRSRVARAGLRRARQLNGLDPLEVIGTVNPARLDSLRLLSSAADLDRRAVLVESIVSGSFAPPLTRGDRLRAHLATVFESMGSLLPRRPGLGDRVVIGHPQRLAGPRKAVVISLVGALVVAGSAAAIVVTRLQSTGSFTRCFAADALGSNQVGAVGSDAVATCETKWFAGSFGAPRKPHLVACILANASTGVFPGRSNQVCTTLGLSVALPPSARDAAASKLQIELRKLQAPGSRCLDKSAALALVTHDLGALGLAGWKVHSPQTIPADRTCATFSIRYPGTVTMIFVPKAPAPQPGAPSSRVSKSRAS